MDDCLYGEMVVNQSQSDRAFLMSLFGACFLTSLTVNKRTWPYSVTKHYDIIIPRLFCTIILSGNIGAIDKTLFPNILQGCTV